MTEKAKEPTKINGIPGPGLSTGGAMIFDSVKIGGGDFFPEKKRGGQIVTVTKRKMMIEINNPVHIVDFIMAGVKKVNIVPWALKHTKQKFL